MIITMLNELLRRKQRRIGLSFRAGPTEFAALWPRTISTISWIPDQVQDDKTPQAAGY